MFLNRMASKLSLPTIDEALPGRTAEMPVAPRHAVLDAPLKPPFGDGVRTAVFGLGCFWGAEKKFWETPGVVSTAVGYAGGVTPNPTYEETCSGRTGHTEAVLVAYDPAKVSYEELLRVFWESHDPTQGMRQGNDVGTQYRSAIYWDGDDQRDAALASREVYQQALTAARQGRDHDRDRRGRPVLLRRGRPPAVPAQGAARLLRARRHGRLVPGRRRRGRRRRGGLSTSDRTVAEAHPHGSRAGGPCDAPSEPCRVWSRP